MTKSNVIRRRRRARSIESDVFCVPIIGNKNILSIYIKKSFIEKHNIYVYICVCTQSFGVGVIVLTEKNKKIFSNRQSPVALFLMRALRNLENTTNAPIITKIRRQTLL